MHVGLKLKTKENSRHFSMPPINVVNQILHLVMTFSLLNKVIGGGGNIGKSVCTKLSTKFKRSISLQGDGKRDEVTATSEEKQSMVKS